MAKTFHDALLWHMQRHGTTIATLAAGAGVSPDVVKKIRVRPGSGTTAKTAERIASFYGKTYGQFMLCDDSVTDDEALLATVRLLSDAERQMLLRQVRGLLGQIDN
jgi:hypothetical protein